MLTQAFRSVSRNGPRNSVRSNLGAVSSVRHYRHWWTCTPDDFGIRSHDNDDCDELEDWNLFWDIDVWPGPCGVV